MKITKLETFVISDEMDNIDPDKGAIEPIACIRIHTDEGITGYAECNCVRSEEILRAAIGYLGSLVIGRNPFQTGQLGNRQNAYQHHSRYGDQRHERHEGKGVFE